MGKYLTPKQLSEILQVSPKTVYDWVSIGFIPHVKVGRCVRFEEDKVRRWLACRERKGRRTYRLQVDLQNGARGE